LFFPGYSAKLASLLLEVKQAKEECSAAEKSKHNGTSLGTLEHKRLLDEFSAR